MLLFFGVFSNRFLFLVISYQNLIGCLATTSPATNFNASLRDYSRMEEMMNSTNQNIKTLQKEEHPARYMHFVPVKNNIPSPMPYREVNDNALSSSTYSHGLSHDEGAYPSHDYEEPHYGHISHGPYNLVGHIPNFDHHGGGYEHHEHDLGHHGGFDHGHGHHHIGYGHGYHKHYNHGLKAILLPVAGLAILGAAAALVSNPVLLQLGVVSGRRRRDTSEVTTGPDDDFENTNRLDWTPEKKTEFPNADKAFNGLFQMKSLEARKLRSNKKPLSRRLPSKQSSVEIVTSDAHSNLDRITDDNFVPVPLKLRNLRGYKPSN